MKSRTKKARQPKAPGFWYARYPLYLVGAAAAALGVDGWWIDGANIPMMAVTALSALVVPASLELLGRSWWSALLLAPALVFGTVNAYSVHHAVDVKIEAPRKAEYLAAAELAVAVAADLVTEARGDLKALAAPVAQQVPGAECRCPQTQLGVRQANADNLAAWQVQRDLLAQALSGAEAGEAKAKADLLAAGATYKPMAPDLLVWIISAAIDASLALGLAGAAPTRARIQDRIGARAEAAKAEAAKAKRKPRKAQPAPKTYSGFPKLAVANDR